MAAPTTTSFLAKATLPVKIGIGGGLVLLLAVSYFFIFYAEVAGKIEQARKKQTALKTELAQQTQAKESYLRDREDLLTRQQRARELNKILPSDSQEAAFLSAIQQASNTSGIDLKAWKPEEETNKDFYAKVPMRLEVRGRYHQIMKFIYELGKVDRIINLDNIELGDPAIQGDEVLLKGRCLATAFRALKKETPKDQPAPGGAPK